MKEFRNASQILFGFLPEQTVDLQGRVWKVKEWQDPRSAAVDSSTLRRELIKLASPWAIKDLDGGYVKDLFRQGPVNVLALNKDNGVRVVPFPNVWMCKKCNRVARAETVKCRCGSTRFGQLPFVGYHDKCGSIREPWIPRCDQHDDVKVLLPGTATAAEIKFVCPECTKVVRQGFGFLKCTCGGGLLTFNVHRAASVYTPRTVVVVNSPSTALVRKLSDAGGATRALTWVVGGMEGRSYEDVGLTAESLVQQLVTQGISVAVARAMVEGAVAAGEVKEQDTTLDLPEDRRAEAESQAVTIAMAFSESRRRLKDLQGGAGTRPELTRLYGEEYPPAIAGAGLEAIELIEKFPVMTGSFGYTRGKSTPGETRLIPFRDRRGAYVVYAEINETESLFVRLRPTRVASWLERNGFALGRWSAEKSARVSILRAALIPDPGDDLPAPTVGSAVLTLVHTYAHRFIRRAAVFAGVDRNALSELLVPAHLGFFVYAAARGDFVLGGLQAVFETELDRLLKEVTFGDSRCPLDPGCQRAGGACMACIHLGEPSCHYYNRFLDRSQLFGARGYLRV